MVPNQVIVAQFPAEFGNSINLLLQKEKKTGSFSLIERVILSAGAMLIFSVYFHLTKCPEGREDTP